MFAAYLRLLATAGHNSNRRKALGIAVPNCHLVNQSTENSWELQDLTQLKRIAAPICGGPVLDHAIVHQTEDLLVQRYNCWRVFVPGRCWNRLSVVVTIFSISDTSPAAVGYDLFHLGYLAFGCGL